MSKNVKCYQCEEKLDKIAIGLNKKLFGRNTTRFYCLYCLSNYLAKVEDWASLSPSGKRLVPAGVGAAKKGHGSLDDPMQ
jgi:hypothetical protein